MLVSTYILCNFCGQLTFSLDLSQACSIVALYIDSLRYSASSSIYFYVSSLCLRIWVRL